MKVRSQIFSSGNIEVYETAFMVGADTRYLFTGYRGGEIGIQDVMLSPVMRWANACGLCGVSGLDGNPWFN